MIKIAVTEARKVFRKLLDEVEHKGETVILTRHGDPVVALVPWGKEKEDESLDKETSGL